jgi:hypothetical protein
MGRNSIASAEAIRLPLGEGDYITVKKELNAGESIDLANEPGDKILATLTAYLVGWSLVGADDLPIPYSPIQSADERRATLRALTLSRMKEIVAVLEPHVTSTTQAIEEKKTSPAVEVAS